MDPEYYKAAQLGNWEAIKKFSLDFFAQRTVNRNTILHILCQFGNSSSAEAIREILERKPGFVFETNAHGETPLIFASRRGHFEVVRVLLDCAKRNETHSRTFGAQGFAKILSAVDQNGNTAFHEAVRNNRYDVVKLLVEEDPQFYYRPNFSGESPLYVAVEKGNYEIMSLILSTCKSMSSSGPGGKTALHAAAARNSPECMELILEKMPYLTKEVDAFEWSALHYAAKFNHIELVRLLLSEDKSMGYLRAKFDDFKTALHVATIGGHIDVVREILTCCPDCWEMITRKRQNVLHLAVENEQKQVLEFILASSWASELINKKDVNGNTPLHLYVAANILEGDKLVNHPSVNRNAFNKKGFTPLDMINQETDKLTERQSSIKEELIRAGATPWLRNVITKSDEPSETSKPENGESYMVVATLIVTVTFAAGFTIPGGYDSTEGNEGMAVLSKKAAFSAFVVSDSLALIFSVIAVLEHFAFKGEIIPRFFIVGLKDLPRVHNAFYIALAMTLMVIAFLTGLYVVLPLQAIKVYLIVIGSVICFPFPVCFLFSYIKLMLAGFSRLRNLESDVDHMLNSIV